MLNSDERKVIADLQQVLDWVGPLVQGRVDQWKADRLKKALDLLKEESESNEDQKLLDEKRN